MCILRNQQYALHCITCRDMSEYTIRRHDRVTKLLEEYALKIDGVVSRYNQTTYNYDNPEFHKRADILIKLPECPETVVDTKVMNISAPSYFSKPFETVLLQGENLKISKYKNTIPDTVMFKDRFVPFVLDITGNLGPTGREFVNRLSILANGKIHNFKSSFYRDLSLLLTREIAETVLIFNYRRGLPSSATNVDKVPLAPSLRGNRPFIPMYLSSAFQENRGYHHRGRIDRQEFSYVGLEAVPPFIHDVNGGEE